MCMIDLKPRNGKLYLTSVLRSNRVSKSGYADYTALTEMGHFLSEQSGLELGKVTTLAMFIVTSVIWIVKKRKQLSY